MKAKQLSFKFNDFKPGDYQGIFTDKMFDKLMSHTSRVNPEVKQRVRQFLVRGKSHADIDPAVSKQSQYARIRYYLQVGINAGYVASPAKMKARAADERRRTT